MGGRSKVVQQPPRPEQSPKSDVEADGTTSASEDEAWQHEVPQGPNCGCMFPWLLIEGLIHLSIYIYKLFDDSRTVLEYWQKRQMFGILVSALCLIAPTFIYAIYEMLRTILSDQCSPRNVLTKLVKGILLVPWQIKGHCEILAFSADKVCMFRRLDPKERSELSRIKQETFVLEFFEDFYSGVVQLLLQVHFLNMTASDGHSGYVMYSEVIGSSLAVFSLIKALQRRDDGCLTKTLSFIGWIAYCASRVLAFGLLSSVTGGAGVLAVILIHAACATVAVFAIIRKFQADAQNRPAKAASKTASTKPNKGVLAVLSFFLFGLPSLVYWPMMFVFKKKVYVFCFLAVGVAENLLCLVAWLIWRDTAVSQRLSTAFAIAVLSFTALGVLFLILYTLAKPDDSDRVALAQIIETNSNKYGIFFDFCRAVHVLPEIDDVQHRLVQLRELRPDLVG